MLVMRRWHPVVIALGWQGAAVAQPTQLALYDTYAGGLHVASAEADFRIGATDYQMKLDYHTTGVVGFFYRGHQMNTVSGAWNGMQPVPSRFFGEGVWRGASRIADIAYDHGKPVIRQLVPPNADEREPVPDSLQANSVDTLSALAELIRAVAATGRCELRVRTYDGRRETEIEAHTVGEETLERSERSGFGGKALRCDFAGRLIAGFKFDGDRETDGKPLHGTAWLASVVAGAPPVPVRMAFETRWFGYANMYLVSIAQAGDEKLAAKP
jgi:hypothetical protein